MEELISSLAIDKHSETRRQHLPDAAAVYCLKGKLWHAHDDAKKAVECYVEALKLNPFMWDAFLGLCDTGENGVHGICGRILIASRRQRSDSQHLQDDSRDDGCLSGIVRHRLTIHGRHR